MLLFLASFQALFLSPPPVTLGGCIMTAGYLISVWSNIISVRAAFLFCRRATVGHQPAVSPRDDSIDLRRHSERWERRQAGRPSITEMADIHETYNDENKNSLGLDFLLYWIKALLAHSDHPRATGCDIRGWQWSWEKSTSPLRSRPD